MRATETFYNENLIPYSEERMNFGIQVASRVVLMVASTLADCQVPSSGQLAIPGMTWRRQGYIIVQSFQISRARAQDLCFETRH